MAHARGTHSKFNPAVEALAAEREAGGAADGDTGGAVSAVSVSDGDMAASFKRPATDQPPSLQKKKKKKKDKAAVALLAPPG